MKKATFDVKNWSAYLRINALIPHTTNSAEALHKGLNFNINEKTPNLAKIFNFIKTNECLVDEDMKIYQILFPDRIRKSAKKNGN